MPFLKIFLLAIALGIFFPLLAAAQTGSDPKPIALDLPDPTLGPTRDLIERFATDIAALERSTPISFSKERRERVREFMEQRRQELQSLDFERLDQDGKIDYLLLQNKLRSDLLELEHDVKRFDETRELIPFAESLVKLEQARRSMAPIDPKQSARALTEVDKQLAEVKKNLEKRLKEKAKDNPSKVVGNRAARYVDELRASLRRWHEFYAGYDPEFSWWVTERYQTVEKNLQEYGSFLRKSIAGLPVRETEGGSRDESSGGRAERSEGGGRRGGGRGAELPASDDEPIIGDPLGREALLDALASEMISYSPEELIELANREFAWCEAEYKKAAQALGFGDDWRKALDHVSNLHAEPGGQPAIIKRLADEAVEFLEKQDLVTIPPLCKEIWRMEMMSPERQRVSPFFTGGEIISVSYPTASMEYEDKLMSMRGNNIHFSRATVQHELIPGHHLQGYMAARYRTHRRLFRTPFLIEGWALYWEMLLWDMGFPRTPEDRIGMLFWRSHRCARIIFSLNFHLGKWTPQECIDFLVERVGHERRNATAEVRRSFAGNYGPLYQAAYMLGGLQIRALRAEVVESGQMSHRQFHDAILRENMIPIRMIRASLRKESLSKDFSPKWDFYPKTP